MSAKKNLKRIGKQLYLSLTGGLNRSEFSIHGIKVHIPAEIDIRIRYFIARKRYENSEAALIREHLLPGDTVIELGGALGVISKVIRDQIGQDGLHIIVEPNPATIDICKTNAAHVNTQVIQAAVAYDASEVELSQDASLLDNRLVVSPDKNKDTFSVATTSLADLHEKAGGGRYSLVCDIEGAEGDLVSREPEALADCERLIMEVHPEYLLERGTTLEAMLSQLEALGFKKVSLARNALYMSR